VIESRPYSLTLADPVSTQHNPIKKIGPANADPFFLAGLPDHRWNQILSDLILFSERLEGLGFRVIDGEVIVAGGIDA